jgi:4-hydroxy-3-methylbut-2-enyl diphosphate reductase IspH
MAATTVSTNSTTGMSKKCERETSHGVSQFQHQTLRLTKTLTLFDTLCPLCTLTVSFFAQNTEEYQTVVYTVMNIRVL